MAEGQKESAFPVGADGKKPDDQYHDDAARIVIGCLDDKYVSGDGSSRRTNDPEWVVNVVRNIRVGLGEWAIGEQKQKDEITPESIRVAGMVRGVAEEGSKLKRLYPALNRHYIPLRRAVEAESVELTEAVLKNVFKYVVHGELTKTDDDSMLPENFYEKVIRRESLEAFLKGESPFYGMKIVGTSYYLMFMNMGGKLKIDYRNMNVDRT